MSNKRILGQPQLTKEKDKVLQTAWNLIIELSFIFEFSLTVSNSNQQYYNLYFIKQFWLFLDATQLLLKTPTFASYFTCPNWPLRPSCWGHHGDGRELLPKWECVAYKTDKIRGFDYFYRYWQRLYTVKTI